MWQRTATESIPIFAGAFQYARAMLFEGQACYEWIVGAGVNISSTPGNPIGEESTDRAGRIAKRLLSDLR